MLNPATLSDLAARWYPNPLSDTAAAAAADIRMGVVWRALQNELPGLAARLDAGTVDRDSVVDVICDAALRALRNPEGFTDGTETIDDYTKSWKLSADSTSADVYFTAAELRRLSGRVSGAFTITPGY